MAEIFISYSHTDSEYAHKLAEKLEDAGFTVFFDDRINYGSQYPHVLQQELDSCIAFLLVMTPRSYTSEWVQSELSRAKRKGKAIFPLLLEGELWLTVESIQTIDVKDGGLPPAKFYEQLRISVRGGAKTDEVMGGSGKLYSFKQFPFLNGYELPDMFRTEPEEPAQVISLSDLLVGDWEVNLTTKRKYSGPLSLLLLKFQSNGDFDGRWQEQLHQHWSKQKFVLRGEWEIQKNTKVILKGNKISEFGARDYEEEFTFFEISEDRLSGENSLGEPAVWKKLPEGLIEDMMS